MLIGLLLPAVQAAREAAAPRSCMNNLKQLGLGLHNYHDAMNRFPSALTFIAGTPDVPTGIGSPLAAILPYLEQKNVQDLAQSGTAMGHGKPDRGPNDDQHLYLPFRYGADFLPLPILRRVGSARGLDFRQRSYGISKGMNNAQCLSAGYGPAPTRQESGLFDFNTFRRISEISDGTSNTYMMGEAATGYPICHGVGCTTPYQRHLRPLLARRGAQPARVGGSRDSSTRETCAAPSSD